MKLHHANWTDLQKYWDEEYGMSTPFSACHEIKVAERGHGNLYVVVAYRDGDSVQMADLCRTNGVWDMQNDGFVGITDKDWNKLRLVPECDWFVIPGNEDFGGLA